MRIARFFATIPTKNYYEILGVPSSASKDDIKKRFIELAKINHPDISPENADKFKSINEAYSVLSKDPSRTVYDQLNNGSARQNRGRNETWESSQPFYEDFHYTVD